MEMILQQVTDPFRIGMIFFLMLTAQRTQATVGMIIPLVLGVVFVAALIPLTIQSDRFPLFEDKLTAFGFGVVANTALLVICLGVLHVARRFRS